MMMCYMYSETEVMVMASNEDKDIRIITAMTSGSEGNQRNRRNVLLVERRRERKGKGG